MIASAYQRMVLFALLALVCGAALPAQGPPTRIALLVGVGKYPAGTVKPLDGPANDLKLLEALLRDRYAFEDICVLRDAEATHAAIVNAFKTKLIDRAKPGTEVVFYFAGHGSRVPDASGDRTAEPDGHDSTLIAYDSRVGDADGAHDLTDDELRSLVDVLVRKTARVTVLVDACHAGEVMRGGSSRLAGPGANGLDHAWREQFWPADVPFVDDGADVVVDADRYVLLSAAHEHQIATKMTGPDGSTYGTFTLSLARALQANPGASWRAVAADARVRVGNRAPFQTIFASGDLDRGPFGATAKPVIGFDAEADRQLVKIDAGWLHGLREGSVVELREPGSDEEVGSAKIVRLGPQTARAKWVVAPAGRGPGAFDVRAVEVTRPADEPPLEVAASKRLERQYPRQQNAIVRFVKLESPAPYRVTGGWREGLKFETAEDILIKSVPGAASKQGRVLVRQALDAAFRLERRYQALQQLAAVHGNLQTTITFEVPTVARIEAEECELVGQPVEAKRRDDRTCVSAARPGDVDRLGVLRVANRGKRDVYVTVLSLDERRRINVIATEANEPYFRLLAGAKKELFVSFRHDAEWRLTRPMRDRFLAIATPYPLKSASELESGSSLRSLVKQQQLPNVLRRLLSGALRSRTNVRVGGGDFGVAHLDLWIE